MKRLLRNYWMLLLVSGAVILLDQWTKALVRAHLAPGEMWAPWDWLMPYARFVHWYNTGVAFGLFQGKGDWFIFLAIIIAVFIVLYYPRVPDQDWSLRLAMSLQLGGALGNMIDRLHQGYVTDFISVGTFPVFNIADSSITIGVIILLLGVYLQERRERRLAQESRESPPENPVVQ
ncbi:MAG: signal peptidase II [Anaerolinea sp.]